MTGRGVLNEEQCIDFSFRFQERLAFFFINFWLPSNIFLGYLVLLHAEASTQAKIAIAFKLFAIY